MVDKSSSKVTLGSVIVVQKFLDLYPDDLSGLSPDRELELELICCWVQLSFLYHRIA